MAITVRASAAYRPPFQYVCENDHVIHASGPIDHCPVARCSGPLVRTGTRKKKADT